MAGYNPKRLRLKSRQAPLTFMRAWYSALPAELRAAQRYTPPSRICGLVTLTCETVEPSESVYWLARCAESRATGSSSNVQVMVGGGAPLAAHMREKGSPGATTRSLKDETIRGVPSERKREREVRNQMKVCCFNIHLNQTKPFSNVFRFVGITSQIAQVHL